MGGVMEKKNSILQIISDYTNSNYKNKDQSWQK